jgi:hypothetical protein
MVFHACIVFARQTRAERIVTDRIGAFPAGFSALQTGINVRVTSSKLNWRPSLRSRQINKLFLSI